MFVTEVEQRKSLGSPSARRRAERELLKTSSCLPGHRRAVRGT